MDKDALMISTLSNALIDLQVKYRSYPVLERIKIRPELEGLLREFSAYQLKLLDEGVITTDQDLQEMKQIKEGIDQAADEQQMILAIGKTLGWIAGKVL